MRLAAHLLSVVLSAGVALGIFAYALRARTADVRFPVRDLRLIGVSLISIFIVTPAIAVAVVEWVPMPSITKLVIVTLSFSIISPTLFLKRFADRDSSSYASALTFIVAIASIGLIPALAQLAGRVTGRPYGVPADELAGYIALILLVPMIFGVLIRVRAPRQAVKFARPLGRLAVTGTNVALVVQVLLSLPKVPRVLDVGTVLGMAAFTTATLGAGCLLAGPDRDDQFVLGLTSASRHPAIAITIASVNYPDQSVSVAMVVCLLVSGLITGAYSHAHQRRYGRCRDSSQPA